MNNNRMNLRDYQQEMKSRLFEAWQRHQSVMVQMPTGTGKTHVLAAVIRDFIPGSTQTPQAEVWIIAHRRELVTQIEETVARYGIRKADGTVRALSIQWLMRHWSDVEEKPSLIIIDEAHHALADSYKELWKRYPEAKKLGMTATPCRMNRKGFTDLFEVLLTSWSITDFILKGRLSLFDYVSIRPDSKEQQLINSLKRRGADGDYQPKEMNRVLNRRPSIERLHQSIEQFALRKKGIVYAISIDHARSIATYYNNKGIKSVAIDSQTPAAERKRRIEDFKTGKIRVLVNVDIFSEGFDCPDVEFVQMARPTLSLAKYLQQVGRGLRLSEGKEACMLIDNVGLHRVFGLPTATRNWEAMFQGDVAGKGTHERPTKGGSYAACRAEQDTARQEEMELVISHDRLLEVIRRPDSLAFLSDRLPAEPEAWQDEKSKLWGLKRGASHLTDARYVRVFDIRYNMAAVRFKDMDCGLVNEAGETLWKGKGFQSLKFTKDRLLQATAADGRVCCIDLYSLKAYNAQPEVKRFGGIELLKIGPTYYSRTKKVYVNNQNISEHFITRYKYYLAIFDYKMPVPDVENKEHPSDYRLGHACILEGDYEDYYWLYRRLDDESILVRDTNERYYHVEDGPKKKYIGNTLSEQESRLCQAEIKRLTQRAKSPKAALDAEKEKQQVPNETDNAIPFQSGLKWGLKVGKRITVPPIYRNVKPPVGRFCVVEKNYSQWGVIAIDGTVLIEPKYPKISIENNGTALLTSVNGKTTSIKL